MHLGLQLSVSDLDGLGARLLLLLGISLGLVVIVTLTSFTRAGIAATTATTTTSSVIIRRVGHHGVLLLDILLLITVASFVASVVTLVTSVTTATTTATVALIVVSILASLLDSLRLSELVHLDLSLGLDVLVLCLKLLPSHPLVLEHVQEERLDTLSDNTNTFLGLLRVCLDVPELIKDAIVVFLGDLLLSV